MTALESAKTSVSRRAALAAAIAAIGVGGVAIGLATAAWADPVDLQVVDRDTGRPLRIWRHEGRLFVAGEPGERYALRVTNRTGGRVEVVLSVDGVNIVTGETASYGQTGYIFYPHQSYDVTGWRKSTSEVAAFSFAPLPDSYAARTGRPEDVGVIGMAVFKERVVPPVVFAPEPEMDRSDRAKGGAAGADAARAKQNFAGPPPPPPPPAAQSAARAAPADEVASEEPRDERLGTAHGPREWSEVTMVSFERATSYPQFTRRIEYDTHAHLVAMGVIPSWLGEARRPNPFPANDDGFVPDPPS